MSNVNTPLTVQSEVGKLEAVLLHYPGAEVENMTPGNAQRALYSEILNLSIAQKSTMTARRITQDIRRI